MKMYHANKQNLALAILLNILLLIYFFFLDRTLFERIPWIFGPLLYSLFSTVRRYYTTTIKVEGETLEYKYGYVHYKIDVQSIRSIIITKKKYPIQKWFLKPTTLKVEFGRYHSIRIAPVDTEELLNDLLAINPRIHTQ